MLHYLIFHTTNMVDKLPEELLQFNINHKYLFFFLVKTSFASLPGRFHLSSIFDPRLHGGRQATFQAPISLEPS
jgi:hypothetical protein